MAEADDLVRIGVVVRPHGIRGELVVQATGETLSTLSPGSSVYSLDPARVARVLSMRPHQGRWLVCLEGIQDRDEAEQVRGAALAVSVTDLVPAGPGEAYVDDLVGCRLEEASGELVGTILAVREGGPQDLLEVDRAGTVVLIPMAGDWLVNFDLEDRLLVLRIPPGLVDLADRPGA